MANYQALDAFGSVITVFSSTIGGVQLPVVKISDPVSVIGTLSQTGTAITSIVGMQAEDSAHTSGDLGIMALAVRNDAISSVTNADRDYSAMSVGPAGELMTANAPLTKWIQGNASILNNFGVSVTGISNQGTSIFTYITSAQVVNASANNVYLTIFGATNSVMAYLPAPANSGAIPLMVNGWKTNANGAVTASISGVASVYLSFQGFISKT